MLCALVALALVCSCVGAASYTLHQPLSVSSDSDFLILEKGQNLNDLVYNLVEREWFTAPALILKVYGRITEYQGFLKAGEYSVDASMSAVALFSKIRNGTVVQRNVTFPEGWTASEWVKHLSNTEYVRVDVETLSPDEWEGWLYPDTYAYTRGEAASEILGRAQRKMQGVLETAWRGRSGATSVKTEQQTLILASMVEKETGLPSDRPIIASVFTNRLERGMKLQSDPTVIYGLNDFSGDLKRSHLRTNHPYNTYVVSGLPKGPICNPGLAAIEAVLHPPSTPYLYFVAKGDGSSYFSTSLEEHNDAVNRFQKAGRVKNYRSTPKSLNP